MVRPDDKRRPGAINSRSDNGVAPMALRT